MLSCRKWILKTMFRSNDKLIVGLQTHDNCVRARSLVLQIYAILYKYRIVLRYSGVELSTLLRALMRSLKMVRAARICLEIWRLGVLEASGGVEVYPGMIQSILGRLLPCTTTAAISPDYFSNTHGIGCFPEVGASCRTQVKLGVQECRDCRPSRRAKYLLQDNWLTFAVLGSVYIMSA